MATGQQNTGAIDGLQAPLGEVPRHDDMPPTDAIMLVASFVARTEDMNSLLTMCHLVNQLKFNPLLISLQFQRMPSDDKPKALISVCSRGHSIALGACLANLSPDEILAQVINQDSNGQTLLHHGCKADTPSSFGGHSSVLQQLLSIPGVDPQCKDMSERVPLHQACLSGNLEMVQLMLVYSDDLVNAKDDKGNTPLHLACSRGHPQIVQQLLEAQGIEVQAVNNRGQTVLHLAVLAGSSTNQQQGAAQEMDQLMVVMQLGVSFPELVNVRDLNGHTPLHEACLHGCTSHAQQLLQVPGINLQLTDSTGNSALHVACNCKAGHSTELIKLLLAAGADVAARNNTNQTPLHVACSQEHSAVAELLLQVPGVDPEARDNNEQSPLHLASQSGNLQVVELLLAAVHPGHENARDQHGRTALHLACMKHCTSVVQRLLAVPGLDLFARDMAGWTVLHHACNQGHEDLVALLLARNSGHWVTDVDKRRQAPLHLACSECRAGVVRQLLAVPGVDPNQPVAKPYAKPKQALADHYWRPLHLACRAGSVEVVRLLLPVTAAEYLNTSVPTGCTPIGLAYSAGHREVVALLLGVPGVDANRANEKKGRTLLYLVAQNKDEAMEEMLRRAGYTHI